MDKKLLSSREKKYGCRRVFFLRKKKETFKKWIRGQVALKDYREIPWPGGLGLDDI